MGDEGGREGRWEKGHVSNVSLKPFNYALFPSTTVRAFFATPYLPPVL